MISIALSVLYHHILLKLLVVKHVKRPKLMVAPKNTPCVGEPYYAWFPDIFHIAMEFPDL